MYSLCMYIYIYTHTQYVYVYVYRIYIYTYIYIHIQILAINISFSFSAETPFAPLCEVGVSINATDKFGQTPAHVAAKRGNVEALEALSEASLLRASKPCQLLPGMASTVRFSVRLKL